MSNVLVSTAGKRVTLIQLFQKELKTIFPQSAVIATDMVPSMSPASLLADYYFTTPRVTAENYIEELLKICLENEVKLVVPTIDTELQIISCHKELFRKHGIYVMVSEVEFIRRCRDKRNTNHFFEEHNIRVPYEIDKKNPIFPMFAKPYDGSLSQDIFYIRNESELTPAILEHPKLIFMEYIDKRLYREFTIDMYYGKDYRVKSIVPRERLEIRAGEVNKGITRKNYLVDFLWQRMNYLEGVVGCICVQLFYDEKTNDVVGIEINPRFGGGYPLSYYAGANYPKNMIREYLLEESIEYESAWEDKTLMLRYDAELIVYDK